MRQTPLAQLVELKLGRPLREYVVEARNSPDPRARSWRNMAVALSAETGVAVTYETLRAWFSDELVTVFRDEPASALSDSP
jgi:hypothetical protein